MCKQIDLMNQLLNKLCEFTGLWDISLLKYFALQELKTREWKLCGNYLTIVYK